MMTEIFMKPILKSDGKMLRQVLDKVSEINQLNACLANYVDPLVLKHSQAIKYENRKLIILTSSGSWTMKWQFMIPDVLEKLRLHPEFKDITAICCKTRPLHDLNQIQKNPSKKPMLLLSTHTAKIILDTAKKIRHTPLRTALEKIAGHILTD